ncbi:hypothetical protein [Bosea sp. ASV33]|uniref:hypothetical protein n=1 Tax=Bosea sp. ASV33 TaxID=2795106 RepID=UPI0018EC9763|nr:hypothetical protein [Bosea sp. ASV33]
MEAPVPPAWIKRRANVGCADLELLTDRKDIWKKIFGGFTQKHAVIPGLSRDPSWSATPYDGSRISAALRPG